MKINGRDLETLPCIFAGRHSLLYLLETSDYDKPVVIKIPRDGIRVALAMDHLANEYAVTKDLSIRGIRRTYDFFRMDGKPVLILEFVKGDSIRDECGKEPMTLTEILSLSISIAQTLGELHRKKIVHRNICSDNLLIDRENLTTTIIDFGIAITGGPHSVRTGGLELLDGAYDYISPEQSGRINRPVDYRTDIYSFGVVMYEMLTGRLPFITSDPLELIHFHIARDPDPPCEVDLQIPRTLSDLVMKLMSKNPRDRYQSAFGLQADLEKCLEQLRKDGVITGFKLGLEDFPTEIRIPRKVYGRESEFEVLTNALENACQGAVEAVLVSGAAGVGKSTLIDRIKTMVIEKGGFFITGTGDVYRRNTPYSVLIQAFSGLVDLVLTESAETLSQWKDEITQTLGQDAILLMEVIPRLALIMDGRPHTEPIESTDARVRFRSAFQGLIRVIERREHPVVVFIDNLQWVDNSSFDLLNYLLSDAADGHFLFIGAYRETEVGPAHPLSALIDDLEKHKIPFRKFHLTNLSRETLNLLVADSLGAEPSYVRPLSDLIHSKTDGSPIFAIRFLQSLSESSLLFFDTSTHRWEWDAERIHSMEISDNLAILMTQEIQKLPRKSQELLSKAACIGNTFDLETLSMIAEQSPDETYDQLESAIEKGLIVSLEKVDSPVESGREESAKPITLYEFPHTRVRQAASGLLSRKSSRTIHLKIGRWRTQGGVIPEPGDQLFEITDHFNEGFQEIKKDAEKLLMIKMNLASGRKAKKAAAYKEAIWYFSMGIGMLPADRWERHYDLSESLYLESMEAEFLCSHFDRVELLSSELLKQARNTNTKTRALDVMEAARKQTLARADAIHGEERQELKSLPEIEKNVFDAVGEPTLLDVNTVIKASQAIASEIELDRLLAKTMSIVIENAGAQRGFLIEKRNEQLIIQAQGEIGQDQVQTMQEIPIEESGRVPLSVVNFVARTQMPVVLDDAFHDNVYGTDKYLAEFAVKSLLCLPVVHKGSLWGVLYLENNLADDVFTPDRIELLKVLSSQAAISMENARLYASLEKNVREIKQAEKSLKLNFERSATLLKLNQMTEATFKEIMDFAFEEAVRLTGSKIGYLAFLNDDETVLTMQMWSRNAMAECDIDDKPIHYRVETTGLWGEAVRQRRPIITNDYNAPNPWKKGVPEGHVRLRRHMNVPVFSGSRIVLVAGVGNKEEDYDETDVQQLTLLMEGMWRLIERKKDEEAILAANERFRSVLRAATDYSIIGTDQEGIIKVFNEGAELMLGYRAEEVVDRATPLLIHDPAEIIARAAELGIEPGFEVFVSAARKGKTETREWTYIRKDGSRITVSLTVTTMRSETGVLSGFIGVAQDITERKRDEEALKESERQYRELLTNLPVAVVIHDSDSTIRYWNAIALELLGLDSEEITGKSAFDSGWHFVDDTGNPLPPEVYPANRVIREKRILRNNVIGILRENDESPVWVYVNAFPEFDSRGDLKQVVVTFVNFSERKQLEEDLEKLNDTLEQRVHEELAKNRQKDHILIQQSRLAAMGEMVQNIAHQWRQPLNSLSLILYNIQDDYDYGEMTQGSLENSVKQMQAILQQMSSTIDDFRNFFQPDRKPEEFELEDIIHNTLSLMEATFKNKNIKVVQSTESGLKVSGFPGQFAQVILNLLGNSKEAIEAAGIEQGKLEIHLKKVEDTAVLSIKDNGGGIPEAILPRIFDPYFTTKDHGSGIGLYMSRIIIERNLKGTITVECDDEGTRITIELPLLANGSSEPID